MMLLGDHLLENIYDYKIIDDTMDFYGIDDNNKFVNLNYYKESIIMILKNIGLEPSDVYIKFDKK